MGGGPVAEKELRCKRFAFLGEADGADDFSLLLGLYEEWCAR